MNVLSNRHGVIDICLAILLAVCAACLGAATTHKAERIIIVKSTRTMTLISRSQMLRIYKVALGGNPVGPKIKAGDKKTPEGEYVIDSKNAKSRFHLALHISYPSATDRERARKLRVSPVYNDEGDCQAIFGHSSASARRKRCQGRRFAAFILTLDSAGDAPSWKPDEAERRSAELRLLLALALRLRAKKKLITEFESLRWTDPPTIYAVPTAP